MPEEYSDPFQSEVIQSLQKLIVIANEHDRRFDEHDCKFKVLESQIAEVSLDLKTLSGQCLATLV
jgi:hypothetical protein